MVGASDHCNGSSGSIKSWALLDEFSYFWRVNKMLIKLRNLVVMKLHLHASPSPYNDAMAVGALNT